MPLYQVIAPGFHNGKLYDPEGKRRTLHTDKPFNKKKNPMPSWLAEMPEETPAQKKKREAYEAIAEANAEEKAEQDRLDIVNASTEGEGEKSTSFLDKVKDATGQGGNTSKVETL